MFVPYRNPNRLTNLSEIWHGYIYPKTGYGVHLQPQL